MKQIFTLGDVIKERLAALQSAIEAQYSPALLSEASAVMAAGYSASKGGCGGTCSGSCRGDCSHSCSGCKGKSCLMQ